MTYTPNFNDPRTLARAKRAMGFVRGCLSPYKSQSWSTRYIDKHTGRNDTDLGKWFRKHLLITTNARWSKDQGVCKEYCLNQEGYEYIKDLMSGMPFETFNQWKSKKQMRYNQVMIGLVSEKDNIESYPIVQQVSDSRIICDWAHAEFQTEFETLEFFYDDKSNRLWHPLQRVRRQEKRIIFSELGLDYQYDIVCCAPTLLHQYSNHIPLVLDENKRWVQGPMDLYLFALQRYLTDRKTVREEIARAADIPVDLVKVIINGLFAGAQLGHNPTSAIYKLLKGDKARIEYLKQDPFITELRTDIKTMWDYINVTLTKRTKSVNGKTRKLPISSRQKWNLYFDLERQVLNAVKEYLDKTGNKYFLEHDGWSTQSEVNQQELIEWIHQKTGFIIQLDMEISKKKSYNSYPIVQQVSTTLETLPETDFWTIKNPFPEHLQRQIQEAELKLQAYERSKTNESHQ